MTDVELDERITTLEETGGGGNSVNGKTIKLYNNDTKIIPLFEEYQEIVK